MYSQMPPPGPGEIYFRLGPFPIRVTPMFWITGLFLGMYGIQSPDQLIAWMLAFFVGILIHELGHALVMRYFGDSPGIVLQAFGGATSAGSYPRWNTTWKRNVVTCFVGPFAGFLVMGVLFGISYLVGDSFGWYGFQPFALLESLQRIPILMYFVLDLLMICWFWGLLNLMPIYPMDGGQILKAILEQHFPRTGTMRTFQVSFIFAVFLAIWFVQRGSLWGAVIFGMLAFQSLQALSMFRQNRF